MPNKPKIRLWPFVLFFLGESALLLYLWILRDAEVQQFRVMATIFSLAVFSALTAIWFIFLSRITTRRKLQGIAGALVLVVLFILCFKFEGMSGDLVPQFRFRLAGATAATTAHGLSGFQVADYPQFQGPNRTAILPARNFRTDWKNTPPPLLWKRPVGEGISGFSVSGSLAITQEQDSEGERIVAYRVESGEPVWEHRTAARYESPIAGVGPRSNPTIVDGRVFTMGSTGWLTSLDLETGAMIWEKNVLEENERPVPMWGKSCSPLVFDGRVIISIYATALVAYSVEDGSELWRRGDDGANYSSPTRMTLAGRDQVVSFNSRGPAGYAAESGEPLWFVPWPAGAERIAAPVQVDENRLLVSSGYGTGTKLFQFESQEDGIEPQELWYSNFLKSKFANFFVIGDHIYGLDDGILVCIELETGKRVWKRGRYGHGQMILVGSTLLLLSEDGLMLAIRPSPEGLQVLGEFQALDGHTWNPPALAGEVLLVRNAREAAAYWLR